MSNAQPVLDMADDDDMGALFPATTVGAPTSVFQRTETEDGLEGLFSRRRELAKSMTWALWRPRKRSKGVSYRWFPCGMTGR